MDIGFASRVASGPSASNC